jgi:hypothetical protein
MPNERTLLKPLLATFIPEWGTPYRVKDADTWESVARAHFLDVMSLIEFNFHTTDPAEVNWYLRRNTGCTKTNGNNWAFSSSAKPGIIYLYKNSPADKPTQPTQPANPTHPLRARVEWQFLKVTLT